MLAEGPDARDAGSARPSARAGAGPRRGTNAVRRLPAWVAVGASLLLPGVSTRANESFGSEFSHVIGGMAIASAATLVADRCGAAENRGWAGFATSVAFSFVNEAVQVAANGSSQVRGSSIDFAANVVGAAFGAWVTDRYVLAPVVVHDAAGQRHLGVAFQMRY
jgi:hypothetical protein